MSSKCITSTDKKGELYHPALCDKVADFFSFGRGDAIVHFIGESFVYCPWCGTNLKVDIEGRAPARRVG